MPPAVIGRDDAGGVGWAGDPGTAGELGTGAEAGVSCDVGAPFGDGAAVCLGELPVAELPAAQTPGKSAVKLKHSVKMTEYIIIALNFLFAPIISVSLSFKTYI